MPIASTAQVTVNTTTTGTQNGDTITTLADGSVVVAWHDANTNQIMYRIQSVDGTWGLEQTGPATVSNGGDLDIVATATGFAIVYKTDVAGNIDTQAQAYNADGSTSGSAFAVTNSGSGVTENFSNAHMLSDGSFVVVNSDDSGAGDFSLSMRLLNSSFAAPGAAISIEGVDAFDGKTEVVNLSNGNFAVFYSKVNSAGGDGADIAVKVFDSVGSLVGTGNLVNSTLVGDQMGVDATVLADGRVLVTYDDSTGAQMYGRIFNADLSLGGVEFAVVGTGVAPANLDTTQLADGRIVMVWEDSGDIKCRLFSSNGAALADEFTVGDGSGAESMPNVAALADGRFTVTWTADDDIRSMNFDPSKFYGTAGVDIWAGGDGNETIFGGNDSDVLSGNGGNDKIYGGAGNDNTTSGLIIGLNGGAGDDKIYGEAGADTLNGDLGNDILDGGAGADILKGGDGNDTLIGGADADVFFGGAGDDTVSYFAGVAVQVNISSVLVGGLAARTATGQGADSFNSADVVENVIGSSTGNDTMYGSLLANKLYGMGGIDTLNGGGGADSLFGGIGNDILNGDAGADSLYGGEGNDTMNGGSEADTFYWGNGNDSHDGGSVASIDTMDYSAASIGATASLTTGLGTVATAAAGDSYVSIENLTGSNNVTTGDVLTGNAVINILTGLAGNDTLIGMDGDDTIVGGDGNDTLVGGTSATLADTSTLTNQEDKLTGGVGNDIYIGGAGMDAFTTDTSGNEIYRYISNTDGGSAAGVLGGDKIASFSTGDGFEFKNAAFGSLGAQADLAAIRFQSFASSNVATNTSVRFVYNQANDTLWYDFNGSTNGATDAVCIADFAPTNILLLNTDIAIIA